MGKKYKWLKKTLKTSYKHGRVGLKSVKKDVRTGYGVLKRDITGKGVPREQSKPKYVLKGYRDEVTKTNGEFKITKKPIIHKVTPKPKMKTIRRIEMTRQPINEQDPLGFKAFGY